jgi:hypothetical protein
MSRERERGFRLRRPRDKCAESELARLPERALPERRLPDPGLPRKQQNRRPVRGPREKVADGFELALAADNFEGHRQQSVGREPGSPEGFPRCVATLGLLVSRALIRGRKGER